MYLHCYMIIFALGLLSDKKKNRYLQLSKYYSTAYTELFKNVSTVEFNFTIIVFVILC